MKKPHILSIFVVAIILGMIIIVRFRSTQPADVKVQGSALILPTPLYDGETSIENAIQERRSTRSYANVPLTLAEVSQLLWAAQGITNSSGGRTAPSAGALYPLEVYLLVGEVNDLSAGIYHYDPVKHALTLIVEGDHRHALYQAALTQDAVKNAAGIIVITAVYERTTTKYGDRGIQYVHIEVGCVAQNVYLQAVSLDLGTVFIGAFDEDQVKDILHASKGEIPLSIMPVGRK